MFSVFALFMLPTLVFCPVLSHSLDQSGLISAVWPVADAPEMADGAELDWLEGLVETFSCPDVGTERPVEAAGGLEAGSGELEQPALGSGVGTSVRPPATPERPNASPVQLALGSAVGSQLALGSALAAAFGSAVGSADGSAVDTSRPRKRLWHKLPAQAASGRSNPTAHRASAQAAIQTNIYCKHPDLYVLAVRRHKTDDIAMLSGK